MFDKDFMDRQPAYGTDAHATWLNEAKMQLEAKIGDRTWNTTQLQEDFNIESFGYGFVFGTWKSDGKKVSLDFTHSPRFYFNPR